MNQIDNISNDSNQSITLVLADASTVVLKLQYLPAIQRWMMGITYGTFEVQGLNVSIHPNLLRGWRNLLPFGITCTTIDGADPLYIDDFSNGRANLYVLTAAEVDEFETEVIGA